ncbi:HSP90 family protein [Streptomyces avidinii]|uniref:Molecular chaperone HtpG n=1 Tax=Streptomyces avidinii TaxID=1895 RepID=A0ABS4LBL7_STRAV|nr:HSP90 family protein [Streptomyces avidinii]MBP2039499.1 molecular chaperone HtpG [Streptomyces avidinii]GGZ20870.1 molecular chaperone HtpG [Streptomyces avidinii]
MTSTSPSTPHSFQVDLRGLVDLLSHHLYSSPRVYVRELLQNAVDAITARHALDPTAEIRIRLSAAGGRVTIEDSGIGLTADEAHSLLATIGRSSKRAGGGSDLNEQGLEATRQEFLGQFGIGLLACFVVARQIRVVTRSARDPHAAPVEWLATDDGSYTVRELPHEARPEPGTTVVLEARPGAAEWAVPAKVEELARDYGSLLPYEITFDDGEGGEPRPVTDRPAVWDRPFPTPDARRVALAGHCAQLFGFTPLDSIDLDLPVAGVRGVAYVLPEPTSPAHRAGHRVHLKGMLLTERADNLLPDWAFFVRAVLDTDTLRPTASRENLYDDETLAAVREALGSRVRGWLAELAASDPDRLAAFLQVHHLGVKSMARHDSELLGLMLPWLPFETSDGSMSLQEFAAAHTDIHFTRTVEEFRQIAPIAAAHGLGVINAGYTYDADLLALLPAVRPELKVTELDAGAVTERLDPVPTAAELALAPFLATARTRLEPQSCDVVLRAFQPVAVPALYLDDRQARQERDRTAALETADSLWSGILGALRGSAPRARLVLNHNNPLIRRIAALSDEALTGTAVESLYGQALLMSQRPLRPADSTLLNRAFLGLLEWATHSTDDRDAQEDQK